jgi:hypothetical protein
MEAGKLDVTTLVHEFEKSEKRANRRTGTFKIEGQFEEAVKTVAKVKVRKKKTRATKNDVKLAKRVNNVR